MSAFTAVDIFAGAGGVTLGLKQAGWKVLAACEIDPVAAETYRINNPDTCMVEGDICSDSTIDELVAAVGGQHVSLTVIAAPCQPFSARNGNRGGDPREQLIVQALAVVERLKPDLVLFENVVGLATRRYAPILDAVRVRLLALGYLFSGPVIHDATTFGVPQARHRCIMLAARSQAAIDAFETMEFDEPRRTVRDAIGNLAPLSSGEADPNDELHRARVHRPIAMDRLRHIPHDGGSRSSLPTHLRMACHKNDFEFPDVYGRMKWDAPSMTLTTGCTDVTKGRYAHPSQDRSITPREAARLQGFPDDYRFTGSGTQISRQIGNAVPPPMARLLARALEIALVALEPVPIDTLERCSDGQTARPDPWWRRFAGVAPQGLGDPALPLRRGRRTRTAEERSSRPPRAPPRDVSQTGPPTKAKSWS